MPIETCTRCQQTFAFGLFRCPRCQTLVPRYAKAAELIEKGTSTMPRITVGAGPTNADAAEGEVGFVGHAEHEAAEVAAEVKVGVHAAESWAEKPLSRLREAAKERNLSAAGSKAELAARIAEHEAGQTAADASSAATVDKEASE